MIEVFLLAEPEKPVIVYATVENNIMMGNGKKMALISEGRTALMFYDSQRRELYFFGGTQCNASIRTEEVYECHWIFYELGAPEFQSTTAPIFLHYQIFDGINRFNIDQEQIKIKSDKFTSQVRINVINKYSTTPEHKMLI